MSEDLPLLRYPETINPYWEALAIFGRRLLWDLNPRSWGSRKKLKGLKNSMKGEKAVILCNGPSLLEVDLSLLENVYTFGLNKINLLFDKTEFRPSCVVSVNPNVLEQNAAFFNASELPLFVDSKAGSKYVKDRANVTYLHFSPSYLRRFARDVSMSAYGGHTVTFVALQLAFHMGFAEVSLVGCDHDFAVSGPANKNVEAIGEDKSHFDPNYFADGDRWDLPDLFESEVAYKMARDMYEASGRKVVNSTAGGSLEIFERTPLVEFLA